MKNYLKYSKFAIATFIVSSAFVACDDDDAPDNTFSGTYTVNTGNIKSAGNAVDLGLPSGTLWADKNVGSSSEKDNGILFVWGDVTGNELYTNAGTYSANPTAISSLFNMYKSNEETGIAYDTTKVSSVVEPITFDYDTASIQSFVKSKLEAIQDKYTGGTLEATFSCGSDFTFLAYKKADGEYAYRSSVAKVKVADRDENGKAKLDDDGNVVLKDSVVSYFTTLPETADTYSLKIEFIKATEVKYYVSQSANKFNEITDQFGIEKFRKEYAGGEIGGAPVNNLIANADFDAATANWGASWQMPSKAQFAELIEKCEWEFTDGGYKVTGPSGNSIFLPAAGFRSGNQLTGNGNAGYYATGEVVGTYRFPSFAEQVAGSKGALSASDLMPNLMIYNYGQFDKSISLVNYLSENNIGVSIRPVQAAK